jgi:hypothetical protein
MCASATARAEEKPPGRRLIVAGAITLGASYLVPLVFGVRWREPELLVPIAGPFFDLHRCHDCLGSPVEKAVVTVLVLDGLAQAAGATLLTFGLVERSRARARPYAWTVLPAPFQTGLGVQAVGTF